MLQNALEGYQKTEKLISHLDSENDPKKLPKRAPIGLLNRFKIHPKRYLNSIQKYDEKLNPKIPNLASKMDYFSGVFASSNRPPKAPGAQLGAKIKNS